MEDFLLNLYLFFFLEMAAFTGRFAYCFIRYTGHFFRTRDLYASTFERGVLKKAERHLKKSGLVAESGIKQVLRDYLCFETRFALENIWIRKNAKQQITGAFDVADMTKLKDLLDRGQFIIATPHNASLYSLVALVYHLGHGAPFMVMNPLGQTIPYPTPLQKSLFRLFPDWAGYQEFIFIQDGDVFKRSADGLESGSSLIIAPDAPSCSEKSVQIDFLGGRSSVAAGVAVLAHRCNVPVLVVVPWAEHCFQPYHLDLKIVDPQQDAALCMDEIFAHFQTGITRNPACWSGWLYWDAMENN